jgi:Ca2+-binding RTX toxin-like protein
VTGLNLTLNGSTPVTVVLGLPTGVSSYQEDSLVNVEGVIGTNVDDTLIGDGNANTFVGGGGSDLISGFAGADSLDGGAGNDTIDYSYLTTGQNVTVRLNGATASTTTGGTETDTIRNFERVIGGAGDDSILGDSTNNTLTGNAGNDTIDGGTGNDSMVGGVGDDLYFVNTSTDVIVENANEGVDSVISTSTTYRLAANIENLTYSGASNTNLIGNNLDNSITGSTGNDSITGLTGNDTMAGDGGDDIYVIDSVLDQVIENANSGSDTIRTSLNNVSLTSYVNVENLNFDQATGNATGEGDSGDNIITGSGFSDLLSGGAGNDTIAGTKSYMTNAIPMSIGGALRQDDVDIAPDGTLTAERFTITSTGNLNSGFPGFAGSETAVFSVFMKPTTGAGITPTTSLSFAILGKDFWTVNLTGNGSISAPATWYTSSSISFDAATGWYRVSVGINQASGNPFQFTGFSGSVGSSFSMWGLQVDYGTALSPFGGGNDTLDGGGGTGDVVDYSAALTNITLSVADISTSTPFSFTTLAGYKTDLLSNFEGIIGGAGNDSLTGDGQANSLNGGLGNDSIIGGLGNDTLDGGGGLDTLDYSTRLAGTDISVVLSGANNVTVFVGATERDTIRNFENILGGSGNDTLTGDSNANSLSGGAGNDSISGGAGNDTLIGGLGADTLDGGTGNDTLDYSSRLAGTDISIVLNGATNATAFVGASESDTIRNIENILGGAGNDTLTGDSNANFLSGGVGNDLIFGGVAGNDTLWGDAGNDRIQLNRDNAGLSSLAIDGGAGTDTLQFLSSQSYTGTVLAAAIKNIEVLDFRAAGANISMSLSTSDIVSMSGLNGSSQRELTINTSSDGNDTVNLSAISANTYTSAANGSGGTDYMLYADANKFVLQAILHINPA